MSIKTEGTEKDLGRTAGRLSRERIRNLRIRETMHVEQSVVNDITANQLW